MNNENELVEKKTQVSSIMQEKVVSDKMPLTIAKVLTPLTPEELGELWVVHPTTNDPVLVSSKLGSIAIWFQF